MMSPLKGTENIFPLLLPRQTVRILSSASWWVAIQTQTSLITGLRAVFPFFCWKITPPVPPCFLSFFLPLSLPFSLFHFCLLKLLRLLPNKNCSWAEEVFSFINSTFLSHILYITLPLKALISFTKYQPGVSVENGEESGPWGGKEMWVLVREVRIC